MYTFSWYFQNDFLYVSYLEQCRYPKFLIRDGLWNNSAGYLHSRFVDLLVQIMKCGIEVILSD